MIPGKSFKPEDIAGILRRRWPFLILPFLVITAAAAVAVRQLPDRYRSETLILVVPQRVPESYVKSTVTTRIEDRLQAINQQIMSRTRLEPLVKEFDLYPKEVATGLMEDVIEHMRRDINTQIIRGDAFRIGYSSDNPRTAMRVTQRLGSMYIDENLRDREVLADGTNQFLDSQLAAAKERLVEHEKKLEVYKTRYGTELPTTVQSNLQVMQNAQLQIQSVVDSISRDKDRRMSLESMLSDLSDPSPAATATADAAAAASPRLGPAATQLLAARKALDEMQQRLKPTHPDVKRMQRQIADLEVKAKAEAAAPPSAAAPPTPAVLLEAARANRAAQIRFELDSLSRQIQQKEGEEERLRHVVADYQSRVEAAPTREAEMTELTRDYETLQRVYTNLLSKKEDAQVAANLERHQIGEQFKILDPARLPERPTSPDRPRLYALGAGAGLVAGLLLVALLEYRDSSLKTDDDVVMALALPVLAIIPELMTIEAQTARVRRRRWISLATAGAAVGVAAVIAWVWRM